MPHVMVVLSGCGRMDGSEIHESTIALLALARGGASYQCFAPDEPQQKVINHVTGSEEIGIRYQLAEAGRIARGDIEPLAQADPADFDAVVVPGGNGAFQNLSEGPEDIHPELLRILRAMHEARKPICAICIAPVLAARALGRSGVTLTIGHDAKTARMIEKTGARHQDCAVDDCVRDDKQRVVSTPAYMLGPGIADVAAGIEKAVGVLLEWCAKKK